MPLLGFHEMQFEKPLITPHFTAKLTESKREEGILKNTLGKGYWLGLQCRPADGPGQTHWGFLSLMTKCVLTFPFLAELKQHAGFCAASAEG